MSHALLPIFVLLLAIVFVVGVSLNLYNWIHPRKQTGEGD